MDSNAAVDEVEQKMEIEESPSSERRFPSLEEKVQSDARSIYVGQVDYAATAVELQRHFEGVGSPKRVNIMLNKRTMRSKGYAYIEFESEESVQKAVLQLDGSLFNGRQIKVTPKRTNIPGFQKRRPFHSRANQRSGRIEKRSFGKPTRS